MAEVWLLPMMALALGSVGSTPTVRESVDLIEVNHFHDDLGRHVYDQVIFYRWSELAGDYHVRAWCLLDDESRRPKRTYHDGKYRVHWFDRDHRITREMIAEHFTETWTQVDPERENKKLLDEKNRVALLKPSPRPKPDPSVKPPLTPPMDARIANNLKGTGQPANEPLDVAREPSYSEAISGNFRTNPFSAAPDRLAAESNNPTAATPTLIR